MKLDKKDLITAEDACAYLGVSKATLYLYIAKKQLPHYKSSKKVYFDPDDLDAFMRGTLTYIGSKEEVQSGDLNERHDS